MTSRPKLPDPAPEETPWRLAPALSRDLADFLEALRVEAGLARNTLIAYRGDLRRFLRDVDGAGVRRFEDVTPEIVIDWLATLRSSGAAEATVARRLSALRMCLRHLVAEGRLPEDPLVLIPAPVLRRSLPATLTAGDVERLLVLAGEDGWRAQRDRALLEVLYASGARVSEAVGLRTDGLQPSLRVLVLTGKGSKTRVVPVGARAREALQRWMDDGRRRIQGHQAAREVFLTRSGKPLDRTSAWRVVKRAALVAGLPSTLSPHTLRHSFATHLIEGGADLRSVQEMLGHASIRTTEIYTHLDADHVRSLHRLYHPRG